MKIKILNPKTKEIIYTDLETLTETIAKNIKLLKEEDLSLFDINPSDLEVGDIQSVTYNINKRKYTTSGRTIFIKLSKNFFDKIAKFFGQNKAQKLEKDIKSLEQKLKELAQLNEELKSKKEEFDNKLKQIIESDRELSKLKKEIDDLSKRQKVENQDFAKLADTLSKISFKPLLEKTGNELDTILELSNSLIFNISDTTKNYGLVLGKVSPKLKSKPDVFFPELLNQFEQILKEAKVDVNQTYQYLNQLKSYIAQNLKVDFDKRQIRLIGDEIKNITKTESYYRYKYYADEILTEDFIETIKQISQSLLNKIRTFVNKLVKFFNRILVNLGFIQEIEENISEINNKWQQYKYQSEYTKENIKENYIRKGYIFESLEDYTKEELAEKIYYYLTSKRLIIKDKDWFVDKLIYYDKEDIIDLYNSITKANTWKLKVFVCEINQYKRPAIIKTWIQIRNMDESDYQLYKINNRACF